MNQSLDLTARGIAQAIASSLSAIIFQAVNIHGGLPADVRSRLAQRVEAFFSRSTFGG